MASQNSSKGNPASHRMSNPSLKARRQRCWANGQRRKEARRQAQENRAAANKARGFTAWGEAKLVRANKRAS